MTGRRGNAKPENRDLGIGIQNGRAIGPRELDPVIGLGDVRAAIAPPLVTVTLIDRV
jgi:hypothetical protein